MRIYLLVCCLLLGIAAVQAQHIYYAPNSIPTPVLKSRHDGTIGVFMCRGQDFTGWELQGNYAVNRYLAVMANVMRTGSAEVLRQREAGAVFRMAEAGIGAYEAFEKGSAYIFGGYGRGSVYNYYDGEEDAQFNINRLFLQTTIAYSDNYFQGGVSLRLSHVQYVSGRVAIAIDPNQLQAITELEEKSPFLLPEFGLNAGVRIKPICIGVSMAAIYRETNGLFFGRLNSSVYLTLALNQMFRKKQ